MRLSARSWMTLLLILTLGFTGLVGCDDPDEADEVTDCEICPDGSDDDDSSGDDDNDSGDDDSADDDDDSAPQPTGIEITPDGEAIPAGGAATFVATVTFDDASTEENPEGIVWETGDGEIATVETGTVTGVAEGATTLTASFGEAKVSATIDLLIGPDVFLYDFFNNTLDAVDRQAETYIHGYWNEGASIGTVPNHLIQHGGLLYLTDSGDFNAETTGDEKVTVFDLIDDETTEYAVELLAPWSSMIYNDVLYVTGELSDNLAAVDLDAKTVEYIDLGAGCVPTYAAGANGKIYVSCTGFNINDFTYGNTVAVYDPTTKGVTSITMTRDNPNYILATEDESKVYVVCVGDYATSFGAVNVIDTATDTVDNSFDIGGSLGAAALGQNGYLFILDAQGMYVVDTGDNDAILRGEGNPVAIGNAGDWLSAVHVHQDAAQVYIGGANYSTYVNSVWVYDADAFTEITHYDVSADVVAPGGFASW